MLWLYVLLYTTNLDVIFPSTSFLIMSLIEPYSGDQKRGMIDLDTEKDILFLFHKNSIIPIIIYLLSLFCYINVNSKSMNQNYRFSNFSCKFELRSGARFRIVAVLYLAGQNEVLETNFLELWGKFSFNPCLTFARLSISLWV